MKTSSLVSIALTLTLLLSACETRIEDVTLEDISVVEKSWSFIRYDNVEEETETFLQFRFSTTQDLLDFAERWILQVRCELEGLKAETETHYPVWGPFHNGHDIASSWHLPENFVMTKREDGLYEYFIYSLPGLSVWESGDHRRHLKPIEDVDFNGLTCFLRGVTKAPVFFPSSNTWTITKSELMTVLSSEGRINTE